MGPGGCDVTDDTGGPDIGVLTVRKGTSHGGLGLGADRGVQARGRQRGLAVLVVGVKTRVDTPGLEVDDFDVKGLELDTHVHREHGRGGLARVVRRVVRCRFHA